MSEAQEKRKRRDFVAKLYPGDAWKEKVASMPTEQITAIYLRCIRDAQKPKPDKVERKPDTADELRLF
jgi:hypothetical protein